MNSPSGPTKSVAEKLPRGKVLGTLYDDTYAIVVHDEVLEAILDYSDHDLQHEIGGFLLGGLLAEPRRCVEIRHFLPAVEVRSGAASLTFTHETWSALHRELDLRFVDEVVLGWHHTHPNFGIFLSGHDLFIHRNFFSEPWQIALVVDPRRLELGFFQWRGEQVVDCGFVVV